MILRKYGTTLHSVELNFDSKALTEIAFRRNHEATVPVDEFEAAWERVEGRELAPRAEGSVQDETEQVLLEDEALVVENESGKDYPKTRHASKVVVEKGENRLHFTAWVEPPLRLARYRRTA